VTQQLTTQPQPAQPQPPQPQPAAQQQVQSPLTLVLPIKSDVAYENLQRKLNYLQDPPESSPIARALDAIGTVHFARFVFLSKTEFAVITEYDGDFDTYVMDFVHGIGSIFDQLLEEIQDAPPRPVSAHPDEFLAFVHQHDQRSSGPLYSAHPDRTVLEIRAAAQG
jgi:hypothetical protein